MTDITQEQLDGGEGGFRGADYNKVATNAELGDVRLLRLRADVPPSAEALTLTYGRDLLSCDHDAESRAAAAIFRFHVKGKAGRKKSLSIEADYAVIYEVGADAHPNAARAFVTNIGLFAAYPYFRGLVAQVVWNAGVDLPPLPTIASTAYKTALAVPNEEPPGGTRDKKTVARKASIAKPRVTKSAVGGKTTA